MSRTYAEMQDLIEQMLQDGTTYDTTELGYWIEEVLKEFATYQPHLVDVRYQIESRTGTDDAGTSGSLTDTSKNQFVTGDVGKVVFNVTDKTWAMVETASPPSVLTLNVNIMSSGDSYEIYNKYCNNDKQIYIGDVTDYLWVEDVEYSIGTRRNFEINYDVLEIMTGRVSDSDPTLDPLADTTVLVRFAKPHRLNQLTKWAGALSGNANKGATSLPVNGLGDTEIIERGDEFRIQHHKAIYTVTADVTTSANAATLTIYPGLEEAASSADTITFTKSTLLPNQEEIFAHLVVVRAVLSDNIRHINAIPKGGQNTWLNYQNWAERKLAEVLDKLRRTSKRKTKRTYSRG